MSSSVLFACSRCLGRHPFEELSSGQQLCKECRGAFPVVKCTYCRSEFQQTSKSSTTSICKKCECNVKAYGKPYPCEYCNIIAAFIGSKCQRCTNSEKKYGPPVNCEQCKQKCAFDRKDKKDEVEGKLLCWLCTLSYKRALAKTKQTDPSRHSHVKLGGKMPNKEPKKPFDKRPQRIDVTKLEEEEEPPLKKANTQSASGGAKEKEVAESRSDHVTMELREQIASLNRQLNLKDQMLLAKERQITDLRASNFTTENELRNKLKEAHRDCESKVSSLTNKLKQLQKDLAAVSRKKKPSLTILRQKEDKKEFSDDDNNNESN